MKRYDILLAGALCVTAGTAFAAIGPNFGLPQAWTLTNTQGYGAAASAYNGASSMCVECHSVNPSSHVLDIANATSPAAPSRTNANSQGSHFVMNTVSGLTGAGATHSGGGFAGGFGGVPRDTGEYFRGAAWTSGATSKFGSGAAGTLTSILDGANDGSATMICESCHNIIQNTANAVPDNDLLVGVYRDNANDGICLGCHTNGTETEAAATYALFHGNDNLSAFAGTTLRKRHHVMVGDTLSSASYTGVATTQMWAPSFSSRLTAAWCTPANKYTSQASITDVADGAAIAYRNLCNVAGSGIRAASAPATLGDCTGLGSDPALVRCTNCHRPHNSVTSAGGFILRYGKAVADGEGAAIAIPTGNTPQAGILNGIRRQFDVGSWTTTKIYQDYRFLCAGCHYGY